MTPKLTQIMRREINMIGTSVLRRGNKVLAKFRNRAWKGYSSRLLGVTPDEDPSYRKARLPEVRVITGGFQVPSSTAWSGQ